jgi:hypothetical protein
MEIILSILSILFTLRVSGFGLFGLRLVEDL